MLTINAPVFDPTGSLLIGNPENTGLSGLSRRVTRTATLDGEASVADFGFTDADRTLEVRWRASRQEYDSAARMLKTYRSVIVSTASGCFLCSPSEIRADDETTFVILLVERKLSA